MKVNFYGRFINCRFIFTASHATCRPLFSQWSTYLLKSVWSSCLGRHIFAARRASCACIHNKGLCSLKLRTHFKNINRLRYSICIKNWPTHHVNLKITHFKTTNDFHCQFKYTLKYCFTHKPRMCIPLLTWW